MSAGKRLTPALVRWWRSCAGSSSWTSMRTPLPLVVRLAAAAIDRQAGPRKPAAADQLCDERGPTWTNHCRCVLGLDVRAYLDGAPHHLLFKAVAHHTEERWVLR